LPILLSQLAPLLPRITALLSALGGVAALLLPILRSLPFLYALLPGGLALLTGVQSPFIGEACCCVLTAIMPGLLRLAAVLPSLASRRAMTLACRAPGFYGSGLCASVALHARTGGVLVSCRRARSGEVRPGCGTWRRMARGSARCRMSCRCAWRCMSSCTGMSAAIGLAWRSVSRLDKSGRHYDSGRSEKLFDH
jgi:hypothetical protein